MRNLLLLLFFAVFTFTSFGQKTKQLPDEKFLGTSKNVTQRQNDSITFNQDEISIELDGETKFTDYKIINYAFDTTYVDTTLSMKKDYKFNYIRKDDFELMPFHNQGQTFNNLGYTFNNSSYFPKMGMRAKYFNFNEVEDIKYFDVPTPTTELMWRTGLKQGQALDALITMNTSERFNFSVAYNGLRSLGKYRETLSAHGNFRTTINYRTKNERYFVRAHFVSHKLKNEENNGLTTQSVELFESGDTDYTDRGRLEVNFSDAENKLLAKRYHLEHNYKFFKEKDSISKPTNLRIGHQFNYETKHYVFTQTADADFGESYDENINDDTGFQEMNNLVYLDVISPYVLGDFRIKSNYYNYNHYYNGEVYLSDGTVVASQLKGNALSVGAEWDATIKNFNLKADVSTTVAGNINGNSILAAATYQTDSIFSVTASISNISKAPNFNFIRSQSDYIEYNWQNDNFKNELIRTLALDFVSEKWLDASANITQLENYSYFDTSSKPQQSNNTVTYLKVKVHKAFTFRKFTLDNTIMYQNVSSGTDVFRVPEFVTRNSLFYSNYLFKNKPLYLQTGITFKYFSEYKMNAYNPLLSEFYLQNDLYGGFPMFDLFIDAKVRTMRLFFKLENFTSSLTGRKYYSAPLHPYRDFTVRFGVVWNFFI